MTKGGNVMDKANKYLLKLQELQFAALELHLYLDTHPYDTQAQQDIMALTQQIHMLMPKVEKYYGPLTPLSFNRENPVRWITEPWPWELHY